ncbi:MAG: (2Fe-2S)-binding protein [Anaerolineae bacterium]|nr:(2Fe-2S)-binding protein [Anaerolineae bacterium]
MPNVRITIDGQELSVPAGITILEAAKMAGIDIPQLCAHPALKPIGACRICLVEVEKQRTLQPSCTFPVSDGMVVHTDSPKVREARRFVLQMLFSERNHFCMYCQMSGSCELQRLAYRYQLDHWEYDRAFPKLPVDASRKYFVMDHNRCILCRRCIRACDELVGNKTLGIKNRGANSMIIADLDVPFGESSCVSCGTCLQVCPTGALMDRASAYMGADEEITRVKSRCLGCSIGCGVELIIRENRVIRIEGDWDAEPNHGLLCEIGRFIPLYEERRRLRKAMVKGDGGLEAAGLDEALQRAAEAIKKADGNLCTVLSGFASTEAGKAAVEKLPGEKVLLEGAPLNGASDSLSCLDEADLFIVVNTDLTKDYQVAGFAVKRGVRHRGARLLVVDEQENGLDPWAVSKKAPAEVDEVVELAKGAELPVLIYGAQGAAVAQDLAKLLPNAKKVALAPAGNTMGLAEAGVTAPFAGQKAAVFYVVAGETRQVPSALWDALKAADTVIVQASFQEPWNEVADVLLPMPTTQEKSGTMTNLEGRVSEVVAGVTTKLPGEVDLITQLGALL